MRLLHMSRTEPARTTLLAVSVLTGLAQLAALYFSWPFGLVNFAIVGPVCVWGFLAAKHSRPKSMGRASFALFFMWFWTGLTRLLVAPDPTQLLWVPFLIVGIVCGICYLWFTHAWKFPKVVP